MKKKVYPSDFKKKTDELNIAVSIMRSGFGFGKHPNVEINKESGLWILDAVTNGNYSKSQLELKGRLEALEDDKTLYVDNWE